MITKIEFFPDYCADGVWITHDNHRLHAAGTLEEIELGLGITMPKWFKGKVQAMQSFFDCFAPTMEEDFHFKYGILSKHMVDMDMIEHILITDFKRLFPEHAHVVVYSGGNEYFLHVKES